MAFLAELGSSTIQYVLMMAVAVFCVWMGAAVGKHAKKKKK